MSPKSIEDTKSLAQILVGNRMLLCKTGSEDFTIKKNASKDKENFNYLGYFLKEVAATDKLIDPSKYVETGL